MLLRSRYKIKFEIPRKVREIKAPIKKKGIFDKSEHLLNHPLEIPFNRSTRMKSSPIKRPRPTAH